MGGVVDSIFSGGDAAEDAADAQLAAQQAAIDEQRRQFDVTRGLLDPFRGAGVTALNEMMLLMGLTGGAAVPGSSQFGAGLRTEDQIRRDLLKSGRFRLPGQLETDRQFEARQRRREGLFALPRNTERRVRGGGIDQEALNAEVSRILAAQQQTGTTTPDGMSAQEAALARLVELPGQRFIRDRAQQALLRSSGAIGGLGGGNVRTALVEQGAGFAAQDLQNRFNRLQNLITGGQAAAAGTGAAAQQTGGNVAQLLASGGQARAQGILGAQQANAGLASNLLGAGLGAAAGGGLLGAGLAGSFGGSAGAGALLGLLSDARMKTDIRDLTPKECFDLVQMLDIKAWRYLPEVGLGDNMHVGPMAQDSPELIKMPMEEKLNLHSELMLIAGALQYIKQASLLDEFDEGEATCQ